MRIRPLTLTGVLLGVASGSWAAPPVADPVATSATPSTAATVPVSAVSASAPAATATSAPASATTKPPEVPAPLAAATSAAARVPPPFNIETGGYDAWQAWFDARVAAAKAGKPELIQLPVAIRGRGWGCQCPDAYVGTSTTEAVPGPWLALSFANFDGPEGGVEGAIFLAEGTLTGATELEDLRNEDGEPEEWLYTLQAFEVQRFRLVDFDGDAVAKVVLSAAEMAQPVSPFADARKHIVVVERLNRRATNTLRTAEAQVQELKARGFAEAEHFDSRRTPTLWAGQEVVVVGRTASSAEAKALATRAKAKGLKPKVYLGF